ncbi:MAG: OmpA family protein [Acidobacteriota bacterium]
MPGRWFYTAVLSLVFGTHVCAGALAQEPTDPPADVPAGAIRTVLDLNSSVLDLNYVVENIAARLTDTEIETRLELAADILFDFDAATIKPVAEETLRAAADFIRDSKSARVIVEGHTDSKGAEDYNQALSVRRAEAVRDWLTKAGGISGVDIQVAGFGEVRPVVPNTKDDGTDDPSGRQRNRRVEIVVSKTR